MSQQPDKKQIIASISKFLRDEANNIDEEVKESLEVAIQCVECAYGLEYEENRDFIENAPNLQVVFQNQRPAETATAKANLMKECGNESMRNGNFEEAVEFYTSAIHLNPDDAVYYCNRAAAYSRLDRHEEALADSKQATRLDPHYIKAFGRLGIAYSHLERYADARDAYKKALQLDPTNQMYIDNLRTTEELIGQNQTRAGDAGNSNVVSLDLAEFFQNPTVLSMANQLLTDPELQTAMNDMMQARGNPSDAPNMDSLLEMGHKLAETVHNKNPELIENLRRQFIPNQAGPSGSAAATQPTDEEEDEKKKEQDEEGKPKKPESKQ